MKRIVTAAVLGLTILTLVVGIAGANGPPFVITFDDAFQAINPCTGELEDVDATLTLKIHEFERQNPDRHHANVQFWFDIETSGGFSGTAVGPDIDNGAGLFADPESQGMFTSIFNGVLSNGDGQRFRLHFNFHITIVDGVPTAFVDNMAEACLGNGG